MSEDNTYFNVRWKSQIKKGLLEYIILLILQKKPFYGYDLMEQLKTTIALDVAEGTLYPLLNRLKKEGLVDSQWKEMKTGIPRKYYHITPKGEEQVELMHGYLAGLIQSVSSIRESNKK